MALTAGEWRRPGMVTAATFRATSGSTNGLSNNEGVKLANSDLATGGNGSMVFGLFANYESVGAEIVRPHAAASPALFLEFSENFDAGLGLGMKFRF